MPALANKRQEKFCTLVADGFAQGAAYITAGYPVSQTVAAHSAVNLKAKPHIQARINEILTKAGSLAHITPKKVLEEMWALASFNPADAFEVDENTGKPLINLSELTREQAKAIDISLEHDEHGRERIKITLVPAAVRLRALELIGKRFGLWIERHEHGKPGDFASLESTDAIIDKLKAELGEEDASRFKDLVLSANREALQQPAVPQAIEQSLHIDDSNYAVLTDALKPTALHQD